MTLNIYSAIDTSSTGDNVDEGFEKCKDNWTITDGFFLGYYLRSKFTYKDADQIYINPGVYECAGKLAQITSQLTSIAISSGGTDWHYLYIDNSAIPADYVIDATDLYWDTTEPAWSNSQIGWYHSSPTTDRCIFAVRTVTDNILKFSHENGLVLFDTTITVESGTVTAGWNDVTALTMPIFALRAPVTFQSVYASSTVNLSWRINGSSGNGNLVGNVSSSGQRSIVNTDVETDSSFIIEINDGDQSSSYGIYQNGWYLPEGI